MKIKKGDNVIVVAGKDRGKAGKVVKTLPKEGRAVVSGVNIKKKHQKPGGKNKKGQIVEKEMPMEISNLMIADPKDGKPSRVGFKIDGGKKVRISKRSGAILA